MLCAAPWLSRGDSPLAAGGRDARSACAKEFPLEPLVSGDVLGSGHPSILEVVAGAVW